MATAVRNSRGRYSFNTFHETGDYSVRIVVPSRLQATTAATRDVLVARGDQRIGGVDFGVRLLGRQNSTNSRDLQLAALDSAFAASQLTDPFATSDSRPARLGARPR